MHHPDDATRSPYGRRRTSRARRALARAASAMPSAFTADELHARVARHDPGVGLATVYRAVAAMLESGYLARVGERDGAGLYAVCGRDDHHHHAVCEECGAVVPVACSLDPSSVPAGFVVTRHEIAVYGVCERCTKRRSEPGEAGL